MPINPEHLALLQAYIRLDQSDYIKKAVRARKLTKPTFGKSELVREILDIYIAHVEGRLSPIASKEVALAEIGKIQQHLKTLEKIITD
jgi:hypothetical protein